MLVHMTLLIDAGRLRLAVAGTVCVAAVAVAGLLLRHRIPPADGWVVEHLYAEPGTATANVAAIVSGAGTLLCLGFVMVAAVIVWRRHRTKAAGLLLRTLLLLGVCSSILLLQGLIQRAGPPQQPEVGTYPSGHATIVTAVVFAAIILYASLGGAWVRGAVALGGAAVLLVCASRVVLAEHWLVDVAGGIVGTIGIGLLAAAILRIGPAGSAMPVRSS